LFSSDYTVAPRTLEEVYSAYKSVASSVLVAGGKGLSHHTDHYDLAIDLSNLGLNYIHDSGDEILIGAMTTLDAIGAYPFFRSFGGGVVSRYIHTLTDDELRQHATIGGVLACKMPFSVLIPILLCLTVDVELHDKGRMSLNDYLYCPPMGELITCVSIAKERLYTTYAAMRILPTDEPYLTGAVVLRENSWRIVVGGRPAIAAVAENASELLTEKGMTIRENVARVASEELEFENYGTCSEQERRKITVKMVRDLINSAWKGFSRLRNEINKEYSEKI
jgi:CO/xanthine dehydrogenase FAD-binding subunit